MRVAAVQAAPVFLDSAATTDKMLGLIAEAAQEGAELCAFGETFLSGYPFWLSSTGGARFDDAKQKAAYAAYVRAAVAADGPELSAIAAAAADHGVFVYAGFIEKSTSGTSVYASLAAIHPDDGIVSIHRKLRPTYEERLVWAAGDGNGLAVHDWKGFRVGGLNCWENWMPLARYSLYAQGETLHVAAWPPSPGITKDITRFIAREGRVYCLSAGSVLATADIPSDFPLRDEVAALGDRVLVGESVLVAPSGEVIFGPATEEETIVYGDIDTNVVLEERQNFDPAGHYGRPDVFRLMVNRARQEPIE
ncbi:MAG: carbon-nitrogen hydrolase family protein [Acidimicrobiia bacterium]|nr:carbon-nitrogen hydrolase family protein [Acidimicrobiia bacterium]